MQRDFIAKIYESVRIDKHVIMPNHIHMIMVMNCGRGRYWD